MFMFMSITLICVSFRGIFVIARENVLKTYERANVMTVCGLYAVHLIIGLFLKGRRTNSSTTSVVFSSMAA